MIKAQKGLYPESQDIAYGGTMSRKFGQSILKIFQQTVPKLKNTKTPKEGLAVLYAEIEKEILTLSAQGFNDMGSSIIDDIIKNSKVEYKHDKVCVSYRKFKKCMKLNKK